MNARRTCVGVGLGHISPLDLDYVMEPQKIDVELLGNTVGRDVVGN